MIAFSNYRDRHPFDRFGVLVTADCDLEHAFSYQVISYLKVVPVSDYVSHIWARKKAHTHLERLRREIAPIINLIYRSHDETRIDIDPERITDWISTSSVEEVCTEIGASEPEDRKRIESFSARIRNCITVLSVPDLDPALPALIQMLADEKNYTPEAARVDLVSQAKNELVHRFHETYHMSEVLFGSDAV